MGDALGKERLQVGLDQTGVDAASTNAGSAMGNIIPSARDCEYPWVSPGCEAESWGFSRTHSASATSLQVLG